MLNYYFFEDVDFIQSVYEYVNSNMYVLLSGEEAMIIDPHKSQELTDLLVDKNVSKVTILLTHEHHDHTSGVYWYQEHFKSTLICQKRCSEWMASKRYLRPMLLSFILSESDNLNGTNRLEDFEKNFVARQYSADITYDDEWRFSWQNYNFEFYHIPGHSQGSSLIILDGRYAFPGDSLLKDIPIITRFPGSSMEDYLAIAFPLMTQKLNNDMIIFPGHGSPFFLNEIKSKDKLNVQFK